MKPINVPPTDGKLARDNRYKCMLVGHGLVVDNSAAAHGLLHGSLKHGGPHDHVPTLVHNYPLPVALVEPKELADASHKVLVVDDVPRVGHHL